MQHAETIIIGAGPAGLACAAALQQAGLPAIVLEKAANVGASWRRHYDRLHLHTPRKQSGLPGLPMPESFPRYPAREQVVAYLEDYAKYHRIAPRFVTPAMRITRPDNWLVETPGEAFTAANVIIASGIAGWPQRVDWPGGNSFTGRLLHSSEYANATPFMGKRLLVVGFGNSGGEIAMDLANTGIDVSVSVRSPINILPRELLGMSMMNWAIVQRPLPYRLMDALNAPLLRLAIGDLAKLGLRKSPKGPLAQIIEDHKIPVLDIGTTELIRQARSRFWPASSASMGRRSNSPTARWRSSTPSSRRPDSAPTCDRCCPITWMRWTTPSAREFAAGRPHIPGCSFAGTYRLPPGSCVRSVSRHAASRR